MDQDPTRDTPIADQWMVARILGLDSWPIPIWITSGSWRYQLKGIILMAIVEDEHCGQAIHLIWRMVIVLS